MVFHHVFVLMLKAYPLSPPDGKHHHTYQRDEDHPQSRLPAFVEILENGNTEAKQCDA
jgi:hypothetical protein